MTDSLRRIVTVVLIIITLLVSFNFGIIAISKPRVLQNFIAESSWATSTQTVTPGEKLVPLVITLINEGPYNVQNVTFYPLNTTLFTFLSYQPVNISELGIGQSYSFTYLVNINGSDKLGTYKVPLKVFFNISNYGRYNETIFFPVVIDGYLNFSGALTFMSPVYPGEKDVVGVLTIINSGNVQASNVTVYLESTYPVNFLTHKAYIPFLGAGGSYQTEVVMNMSNNATLGSYIITLRAEVYGKNFTVYTSLSLTGTINILASARTQGVIFPGSMNNELTLVLFNTGNAMISNVTVYPVSSYPFKFLINSISIPLIQGYGDYSVLIPFNVYPNASIGVYNVPFIISYLGTNRTVVVQLEVSSNVTIEGVILSANWVGSIPQPITYEAQAQVAIEYEGPVNELGFQALIYLPRGFTNITGGNEIYLNGPSLPPGTYTTLSFTINVGSVLPGSYVFPITIKWIINENGVEVYYQQNSSFTLEVNGRMFFLIYSKTPSLYPNTLYNVTYTIFNQGSEDIYNVTINVIPETPGIQLISTTFRVPVLRMNSNYSFNVSLYIPPSLQGETIALEVLITYLSPEGISGQYYQTFYYYVPQINNPSLPVYITFLNNSITLGKVEYNGLILKNIAGIPLYNVSVVLSSQELYINTTSYIISELTPGEEISIPVRIFTQVPGLVVITTQVTYYTQLGQLRQEEVNLDLLSSGSVNLIITGISTIPTNPVPGQLASVTATIYNFGTGEAKGVTVITTPPPGITVVGEPAYYVGNVGSFSSATFTYAFLISNTTRPGTYVIPIKFIFTNDIGQVIVTYSNLTITVYNPTINTTTTTNMSHHFASFVKDAVLLGVVILIIVVLIAIISVRRAKKK